MNQKNRLSGDFNRISFLHQFEKGKEMLIGYSYKKVMNELDSNSLCKGQLIANSRKTKSVETSENYLLTTYVKDISFDMLKNQKFFCRLF